MHTVQLIAIRANDEDEAISEVKHAISSYGEGNVWDWYEIGGRWRDFLDGETVIRYSDNPQLFMKSVNDAVAVRNHRFRHAQDRITGRKVSPDDIPDSYSVMGIPVNEDKETIAKTLTEQNARYYKEIDRALNLKDLPSGVGFGMAAFYLREFSDLLGHIYCFDSAFFDGVEFTPDVKYLLERIEAGSSTDDVEKLEQGGGTLDEQWLVVVDLHN